MRKIWIIGGSIAISLVIIGAALPYLFSVKPLKFIVVHRIEKKIGGQVSIDRVRFSWKGPQKLEGVHISTPEIQGTIDDVSSTVPFWSIGSFASRIEQINGSGSTRMEGGQGRFSLDATRLASNGITIRFSGHQMPTVAMLKLLKANTGLQALIGPTFNAEGSANALDNAGQLELEFSSPKTQGSVHADFTPDAITLQSPLTLTFFLTPELTQTLTKGALSVQSKSPTYLRVEPNGFFLPRPFALEKVRIDQATLDFGKVVVEHANLIPLATLLKADSLNANQIDMWLTNVNFSLQKGRLKLGRIDALLQDSVHLCAWGHTNLVKQQLDMIFGVPADTLVKSLRIKNISSTYVLQIPVTGSFRNPDIDSSSAGAKIAILVAGNQAQKQGGVIGGVATLLGKAAEEKSPPPKRPFPWE